MRWRAGLAGLAVLLAGCAGDPGLRVQATVVDDLDVVAVPALAVVTVNLDAGFAAGSTTLPAAPGSSGSRPGSFVGVAEVTVREGDRVTAGQPVVRLDDRLLRAGLTAAEADLRVARGQVGALVSAQDTVDDAGREIADKRAEVKDAIAELKQKRREVRKAIRQLASTRTTLTRQRAALRNQRDQLIAQREQLQRALAALPAEAPNRPELEAGLARLDDGIGQLAAALKKLDAGLAELGRGLTQARTGLAKLNTGIRKATEGLAKLEDAAAELRDARAQLVSLHRLAEVAVDTASVGVDLARAQLDQAVVVAPRDGTIVRIAAAGDRLAAGATLAAIRPDQPSRLVTWLSPTQAATVCVGDAAEIRTDWGETATAGLSRIATAADFPPTSYATDEVHLTRAFAVELTSPAVLPAGAPVTVSLQPCRPNPSGAAEGEPHGNP